MAKITSNQITFVDITDSRKLDIYISSNLPTTQIRNSNTGAYSPDWSVTNLQLTSDVYLDSKEIIPEKIQWYTRVGTTETLVSSNPALTVSTNVLSTNPIITYICKVEYQNIQAFREITFMRTDTGLNGSDGEDAPTVLAQYSIDGTTGWTSTLNTSTHKYIRHSYDGGKTWTAAIKMVGEDGTSVRIKGTATSATKVEGTDYYTLVYNSSVITGAELGDSYLYGGNLYVCADSRDGQDYFTNVGAIQGPKGGDGLSSYVFIRYATDANGTGMSTSPSGKTYMGVYTSNTNTPPTTASVYTWSKFVGDNAKSIVLSGDSQVFKVSKTNVITPSSIKVTAQAFNTTITDWTYSTNGGQTFLSTVPTGVSRNGSIVTVTGSTITSNSIVIKASDGQVEDIFTVYKAIDGSDGGKGNDGAPAPIAFLTNENITFSANAQGQIPTTTITSNVVAYSGTTKVTPTIGTISGAPTGMTITSSTITASNEVMLTITIANNSTLGSASSNMGVISIPVTYPVSTVLYLTWSKVNSGATGSAGAAGSDAYTVILTNESNTFAGDVSNAIAGSTTTQILAYKGATAQTVTISSVNGKTAATTDTDTGIVGLKFKCSALSGTSPTITFTCTTAFVSTNGSIPIVLSVGGVSFTKIFTYSIAFKGATGGTGQTGLAGAPATSYWLVSNASAIQKTSTGTITVTPSTLTFTGKSQTGTATPIDYACRWIIAYSTDGTNYTNLYTSTANEASKSITVLTTYKTIRARMYLAGGTTTLLDEQIIPIVSDGAKGDAGRGVSKITEYYLATTASSGVTTATSGWTTTIQSVTSTNKYLWNYEVITYTDNTTSTTTPIIIGVFGNTGAAGKGIKSVTEYYLATTLSSGVTTSTSGWTTAIQTLTATNKYLWNYELITYTDDTTTTINPVIIGAYGDKGASGTNASLVDITPSAYYFKSTTGKDGTFTPDYIYVYPRFQTVTFSKWEYSVNGGTTWVAASSANGLTIGTYNSIANTLRIARTSTLYTDTVTSISFRCVSSNAAVYDTVSIAKIYDVVDLDIGGRNLLTNSGYMKTLDGWVNYAANAMVQDLKLETNSVYGSVLTVTGTADTSRLKVGKYIPYLQKANRTLTFSMVYSASVDPNTVTMGGKYSASDSTGEYSAFSGGTAKRVDLGNGFTYMECPVNLTYTADTRSFFVYIYPKIQTVKIVWCKLEDGNKATDWTPAPEDVDTNITKVDTRLTNSLADVKTTTDSITSRVSATEQSITTINGNVSSLSTRVSNAEQKITSTAIVSTVRQSTDYINDLGKKVGTTEIISKINQTAESITISANKIGLLGATNIPDLTADKIKGGTLTLGGSSATTQSGQLLVKNASNVDMLKLNKDGIVVQSGHLAVAEKFANQTYNWSTNTWTTTTNTSQLDIGHDYIRMGVYSPSGYANYMRLLDNGLYFQGNAQGIGSWGSFIGHDDYGDFVIQDTVRGYIVFKGPDDDTEIANISDGGLSVRGVYSNTIASSANVHIDSSGQFYRSTSSSKQYKTDIQDIQSDSLNPEKLYDLPVREFKFKDGYLAEEDHCANTFVPGFIAEEVAEIYPIACEYDGDKPENWNIRFIVPAMLKLIQDQNKKIEALEEQINNKAVSEK